MYSTLLRQTLGGLLALGVSAIPLFAPQAAATDSQSWVVKKHGVELDTRSEGLMLRGRLAPHGTRVLQDQQSAGLALPDLGFVPQLLAPGGNIQVNDGSLDHVVRVPGAAPFVLYIQSETALAVYGRNIVATYNTSAFAMDYNPAFQFFAFLFRTGFSTSRDGGRTWTSGFLPPIPGSVGTFGDPSVAVDRRGNFYAMGWGFDADNVFGVIGINISANGGTTWRDPVVVYREGQDDVSDRPWMAVGPDPVHKDHDNVYVTWMSHLISTRTTLLRLGRSTDGGATWSTQILPVSDPNLPDKLDNAVPFVDASTGTLYIPFLHFSPESFEQDFIRILISADGGNSFSFATFEALGAPNNDPTLLPVVPPGEVTDCGSNFDGSPNFRLTIHAGSDVGGGRQDADGNTMPRFVQASRVILQPAFAARNGSLYLAWSNSRSEVFGDGTAGSDILFMRSDDGGKHWTRPMQVNPTVREDIQHVLPTLAINEDPSDTRPTVYISYYTLHRDGTVDVDTASSRDGGRAFTAVRVTSTPFALAPTNIPLPLPHDPFNTVNFDSTFESCYNLGEYMSAKVANGTSYVLWSDSRNMFTEPRSRFNPLSGQTHPQQDIFFEAMPAR